MEDWDLWLRLAKRTGFAHSPKPLVCYRIHEHQITTDAMRLLAGSSRVLDRFEERERALSRRLRYIISEARGKILFETGYSLLKQGRRREAQEVLIRSIWLAPSLRVAWKALVRSFLPSRVEAVLRPS